MLRISLIVAILASVATLVLSQFQVATKLDNLKTTLTTTQGELATSQRNLTESRTKANKLQQNLDQTSTALQTATNQLADVSNQLTVQRQRADRFESRYTKTITDLNEANRKLGAWEALGIPVGTVHSRLVELEKSKQANKALNDENKVMLHKIDDLKSQLAVYVGDTQPPPALPAGLKGKVVAVDPKWDFVVLNIGGKEGVLQRGELLVNRGGKLVAKLRVTRVQANSCVANVMPEWKQAEVKTGDQVIY